MAEVSQREWRIPGQRTKRKAWGFTMTTKVAGKPKRIKSYRAEWSKEQAEEALAKALLKVEAPKAQASGITFKQAVDQYLAAKARKRTLACDLQHLNEFVSAFGGSTPLSEITAAKISAWKADKLKAVSPLTGRHYAAASINRPLAALRHLLRLAHEEWEAIPAVPKVRLEREPQGRLRWLTQDEITGLLAACLKSRNTELHAAVVIALNTGLRKAELYGLTWDRIDLSRGVIRLEVTKSGNRREVPLNDDSYRALVSLQPREAGHVFKARTSDAAYLSAVAVARLADVTFHTLRHTFASWAMMRGASLKELQELLGHASLTMTMRYAHLSPDRLRTAVSRLAGLTTGAAVPAEVTEDRAQARAHEPLEADLPLHVARISA
jgi:integrase